MAPGSSLVERLEAAFLSTANATTDVAVSGSGDSESTADRILDAAMRRFLEVGINSTTMSSIATEADLSREWVYRHFSNRDGIVSAMVQRELRRFIDGLAARGAKNRETTSDVPTIDDIAESITETFVYCVEFMRDHPLVERLLGGEAGDSSQDPRSRIGAIVTTAVRTCAGYLHDPGGFDPATATVIAETLTRLVGSTVVAPVAALDFHDSDTLRDYAARIVPAIVRSA